MNTCWNFSVRDILLLKVVEQNSMKAKKIILTLWGAQVKYIPIP